MQGALCTRLVSGARKGLEQGAAGGLRGCDAGGESQTFGFAPGTV